MTQAELDKAKNRLLTSKLLERETNNGKASALGQSAVVYGDANRVNTDLAELQAVTAAQIKDVLNKYITGKKKVVIEFLPEAMKPLKGKGEKILMRIRFYSERGIVASRQRFAQRWRSAGSIQPPAPSAPHEMSFRGAEGGEAGKRIARDRGGAAQVCRCSPRELLVRNGRGSRSRRTWPAPRA